MVRILLAALMLILLAGSAQAKLGIEKIQAAYGRFGPERKSLDLYPFDELTFRFNVTGAKTDAEGKVDATVVMQVLDGTGKVIFENQFPSKGLLALGGNTYPGVVNLTFNDQVPAAKLKVKVTVKDNLSGESASFERQATGKPAGFKIVGFQFFRDPEGKIPGSSSGCVGESLFFRLRVVGFDRSQGRIHMDMLVQTLDADGKELLPKEVVADARQDDASAVKKLGFVKFDGNFSLNRVGKFTLRVTITDRLSKKSTKFEVPIQVTAP